MLPVVIAVSFQTIPLSQQIAHAYVLSVIPKSVTPERIKANIEYFKMDPEDVEEITKIGREEPVRTW